MVFFAFFATSREIREVLSFQLHITLKRQTAVRRARRRRDQGIFTNFEFAY